MFLKTFKARLMAVTGISIVSFLILGAFFYSSTKEASELEGLRYNVKNIETSVLQKQRQKTTNQPTRHAKQRQTKRKSTA